LRLIGSAANTSIRKTSPAGTVTAHSTECNRYAKTAPGVTNTIKRTAQPEPPCR
jgi:hypothetical protein